MYDTIHIYIDHNNAIDIQRLNTELNKNYSQHSFDLYCSANYKNFKVYASKTKLILQGSLAKYFFGGENQSSLNIEQTKNAIESLCKFFKLDLRKAIVTRLDFGNNLILEHNTKAYCDLLSSARYYNRFEKGDGVYFENEKRRLVFYDKISEQKHNKTPLLPEFEDKNLLRYEVRLFSRRRINQYFKFSNTKLEDLYNPVFFNRANEKWKEEFMNIYKHNDIITFEARLFQSPKAFTDQMVLKGINEYGGFNELMKIIKNAKNKGDFEIQDQYARLVRRLKKYGTIPDCTSKNKLVDELEQKIVDAHLLYASSLSCCNLSYLQ